MIRNCWSVRRLLATAAAIGMIGTSGPQWAMGEAAEPAHERVVHQAWTFRDGVPEGVQALAQTADGYLWLGTQFGLFRFDGRRFEAFQSPFGDRLMSTSVSALMADVKGGLWVGYLFGGFSFVKNGKVTNFVDSIASTQSVLGFAEDSKGIVWSATGAGLWRFDGRAWRAIGDDWNAPSGIVYQLGFDRDGILWALRGWSDAGRELFCLLPGNTRFRKAGDNLPAKLSFDADRTVLTTREPAASEPDLGIKPDPSLPAYPILRKDSGQFLDRANGIWIMPIARPFLMRHPADGSLSETLRKVSPGNSEVFDVNPNQFAFLVDREGTVWFGDSRGIHRFSYSPVMIQDFPLPAPTYALTADDDGAVWVVAGDYNAATVYRVAGGKVTEESQQNLQNVAYRAPDRSLWFGGKAGLWRAVDGKLARVELPPEVAQNAIGPRTIAQDRSGGTWVSFGAILYRYADGVWTRDGGRIDFPKQLILSSFADRAGRVWFGSSRSRLTVIDGDRLLNFGPEQGVRVGNITAIEGRGSQIWIGGEFGLQLFDNGTFRSIASVDKESLRGVSGIVETADGDLWLNALGGIFHIRQAEIRKALQHPGYEVIGERFGRSEGLPGLPLQIWPLPTAVEGTDGRLWFTANNGVVWLDPRRASGRTAPPAVSIQSISADDKGYEPDQRPRLPAGVSGIKITYAAVSLLNPEAIRFRYRLHEVDGDWHDAGGSTAVTYRSLPPAPYRFEVAATDANGSWSGKSASVQFDILPAYYQTGWFRALCAVLLLALAWGVYRLRIRSLQRRFEMTLDARVAERTRIARELHDTLLQSFHALLLHLQTVLLLLPGRSDEAKNKLGGVIDQAANAITEGREAVQALRESTVQQNDLSLAIGLMGEELARDDRSQGAPELAITVEGGARDLHALVRDEIYRIAGEALRNAFQHARARRIDVALSYGNDRLELRVRDDGTGIDPSVLRKGREGHYGLAGMQERANVIGARLDLRSELGAGTEVHLEVPARRAYARKRRWSLRGGAETA